MKLPHPLPYQGSKRALAVSILKFFPLDINTLYEPFAGSAAISIAAAARGIADSIVLSDLNEPLIELWRTILNTPNSISDEYEILWNSQLGREQEYYNYIRDEFNQTRKPHYFLYLLARCVKGAVRYNSKGEFNQGPDKRRKGTNPLTMRNNIFSVKNIMGNITQCVSQDYKNILEQLKPLDLVYMDPPYQGVVGRNPRYLEGIQFNDFVIFLHELNIRRISYIVSYDGRTGKKSYGNQLPENLHLHHLEIAAGRSSQATLLGRDEQTFESLYLSSSLLERIEAIDASSHISASSQQLEMAV